MAIRPDLLQELKGKRGKLIGSRLSRRERLVLDATMGPKAMITGLFDFSASGGAIGTYSMVDSQGRPVEVPPNAIITSLMTDSITAFTSGGLATVAIKAGATTLKSATAFDDSSLAGVDSQTVSPTKVSVDSQLSLVVAVAALTAGKMRVFVEYVQSDL